ncbi:MAG TPA: hypothetical protein PKG60_01975 [Spirochaetota bacterium]|nr:hypothetical protein [Spirochaetota bacterium]HPS86503.1 hypothetical protein [Spirochaetota bacterium]
MNRERKPNRMAGCDYSSSGLYFITINVRNRETVFGEIIRKRMVLNTYGEIAKNAGTY